MREKNRPREITYEGGGERRGALGGVDRSVIETVALRERRGQQQAVIVEPAYDRHPFTLRVRPQIECRESDDALHGLARRECGEGCGLRRQRLADRHDARTQRFGGEKRVEMLFGRETAVQPRRVRIVPKGAKRARLPVPPCGFQRLVRRHCVDGLSHLGPVSGAQRRTPHDDLSQRQGACAAGLHAS